MNAELGVPVNFTIQDGNTYADKLNAMLGARDVPDLLCVPGWEVEKIPRFAEAIKVLFEDLTDHLRGAAAAYPMLASFPTGAWRRAVWNERIMSVPNPTDGPFPWALFTRKDVLDARGLGVPSNLDDLLAAAKQVTDPARKVWAFNDVFAMIQMFHKVPGHKGGWRVKPTAHPSSSTRPRSSAARWRSWPRSTRTAWSTRTSWPARARTPSSCSPRTARSCSSRTVSASGRAPRPSTRRPTPS
ncbi:extracellular solute-binding protein [Micromonospora sp. BRA006-A]|nr:extracellular solute-binding protein [Micromonospora sp. BRA006-A]